MNEHVCVFKILSLCEIIIFWYNVNLCLFIFIYFFIKGARRFVVLDFGKPVMLTDIVIPSASELSSLSIDVWTQGEEVDGQRIVVCPDIGMRSLVLNDMQLAPVCRYLKVSSHKKIWTLKSTEASQKAGC